MARRCASATSGTSTTPKKSRAQPGLHEALTGSAVRVSLGFPLGVSPELAGALTTVIA